MRNAGFGGGPNVIIKALAYILVFLLCLVITIVGAVWVLEKGPSPSLTGMFCRSVRETSAIRWMSGMFLSDEELEQYLIESTEDFQTSAVNTSLIHIAEAAADSTEAETVELISISAGTCKGKLLIVHNPKQVILGTSGTFGKEPGIVMTDMVKKYDALAGINAGGFDDSNGLGNGGTPVGMVISNGIMTWGTPDAMYNIVGIDDSGVLNVGTMTGQAALNAGIKWGVSFVTHDGLASSLIINGEVQTQNLGAGINPRTAIGQRADGAILLLVLDGRSISTLGATMENICDIMLEYGAVNAGNLDGGSSSVMVYNGEIINNCASVTGPRRVPTGFLVMKGAG